MPRIHLLLVLCSAWLLTASGFASGAYPGRPPKPPTVVDSSQYNLGKQIFAGKANLGPEVPETAAAQKARLEALQGKLPKSAQKNVRLPDYAGKLSPEQMQALEYFLQIRYHVK